MAEINLQAMNTYTNNNRPITFQANQAAKANTKPAEEAKTEESKSATEQAADRAKDTYEKKSGFNPEDVGTIDQIIENMKKSLNKLSETDITEEGRASVNEALKGLQKELGTYVNGYNSALSYAQSSSNQNTLSKGAEMVTRTSNVSDTLKQLGINIEKDNSLTQKVKELDANAAEIDNAFKAYNNLFKGNYSYGRKTLDTISNFFGQ
ncbi:MAG: hypothetical protein LBM59_00100 [Ruminococcus sp.]|jgi:hypothetical protein|nr:hypothetical protein [Ruminococcus sp.]